jgi:imidazolonepropionase-like amidohydrolase
MPSSRRRVKRLMIRSIAWFLPLFVAALAAQTPPREPGAALAIRNITVIPVNGAASMPATSVIVRGDRIAAIGPTSEVAIPPGARVVDGTGKYLAPGFIELHAHLSKTRASSMGLFVIDGVTTVRDMGGDYEELLRWRREVAAGVRIGPRILMAGPILESTRNIDRMRKDPPSERVEPFERMRIGIGSPEEARKTVARLADLELDFLKIRTVQNRETYLALNAAADAHSIPVVGHVYGIPPQVALDAGQDAIEHSFLQPFDKESREERLAMWRRFAEAGVPIVPTLVVVQAALTPIDRLRAIVGDDAGKVEPRRAYLSKYMVLDWKEQLLETTAERQQQLRKLWAEGLRDVREMHEAGMELLAGSDVAALNVYPGSSLHDELALFVKDIGMTPAEAIERATRRSARFLRIGDSVGTIERGKVADLVLLEADPLQDIANTRRIAGVVLRGQFYDRDGLEGIRAKVKAARDLRVDDWGRKDEKEKGKTKKEK